MNSIAPPLHPPVPMATDAPSSRPARTRPATVALVVDHPARDLAGLVLVALALARRGITCHLVPLNLLHDELWTLAPDLAVLNYARPNNAGLARRLLAAGIAVGVLDTEGAAWVDAQAYRDLLWPDRALLHRLSFICMWGPALGHHLLADRLFLEHQVAVTGCPRFDFYHPRWRSVLAPPALPTTPSILINTNFSYGNPRFASAARNREHLERDLGLDGARVGEYLATERSAMLGMIDLARNLASDFPGIRIVLRPHPFENQAPYRDGLRGVHGVEIDGDGPVHRQLFAAAAVIQRSCSTAAEATMAGVPTLSPQWIPAAATIPFAEAVSVPCATYDDARRAVTRVLAGRARDDATDGSRLAALREWFGPLDGLAHQRVADVIRARLPGRYGVDPQRCTRELYQLEGWAPSRLRRFGSLARYALRLSPAWSFRKVKVATHDEWRRSAKHFDAAAVQDLADRIARASPGTEVGAPPVRIARADGSNRRGAAIHAQSVTVGPPP